MVVKKVGIFWKGYCGGGWRERGVSQMSMSPKLYDKHNNYLFLQ
jgi:hypothetical protein